MTAPSGQTCFDTAMLALQSGDAQEAALRFERAARAFLAEGAPDRARQALSNLGYARKLLGDFAGALQALDEAMSLLGPGASPQDRGLVLLNRAGVLDRLGDPRARAAWGEAGASFAAQPLMMLVCIAHAAGAGIAAGEADAFAAARAAIDALGPQGTPALIAGLLGAVGDSAGAAGVPFLAQAVWLMRERPGAFNPSNVPYLVLLADRLGPAHALCTPLCAQGLLLAAEQRDAPEHDALLGPIVGLLHRVAAAHGKTVEALIEDIRAATGAVTVLGDSLRGLVPEGAWLVAEG